MSFRELKTFQDGDVIRYFVNGNCQLVDGPTSTSDIAVVGYQAQGRPMTCLLWQPKETALMGAHSFSGLQISFGRSFDRYLEVPHVVVVEEVRAAKYHGNVVAQKAINDVLQYCSRCGSYMLDALCEHTDHRKPVRA